MKPYSRENYDAEIDGPVDPPPKKAAMTGVPRRLAGIAAVSVVCAAVSIYVVFRREWSHGLGAFSSPAAVPRAPIARPSASRPLFGPIPASLPTEDLPASEISLAAAVRRAEVSGGESLWRSPDQEGIHPTTPQWSAAESLKPHVAPGQKIDGWLMQVRWSILRDRMGSNDYTGRPPEYEVLSPAYEVLLRFPEDLAGCQVLLWSHNIDFRSKEYTCPNRPLQSIKDGDWVRVSGVLRPESRIEWGYGKSDESLSLGELTLSDIQRVEAVPK